MHLTIFYRCRGIGSGHRILAELSVIEMFDVHRHILISKIYEESRLPPAVRL